MRRTICVAMVALAVLSAAAAGLADAQSTANPQGLAVARAVKRAYEKVRFDSFTTTGSWVIRDSLSPNGSGHLSWDWNLGYVPRGWVPASVRAVVGVRHDITSWMVVDVFPHCRTACRDVPARFVLDKAGLFAALGSPPRTCFKKVSAFPWRQGKPWFGLGGPWGPPVYGNGVVVLTQHRRWSKNQTITETFTISTDTMLLSSLTAHISRGGRKHPAFTIRSVFSRPAGSPHLPRIHLC